MNLTLIFIIIIALQQDFFFPVCVCGVCVCVKHSISLRPEKCQMSLAVRSLFSCSLKLPRPS